MYLNFFSLVNGSKHIFDDPSWQHICDHLDLISNKKGVIKISVVDGPDLGPVSLQLRADSGVYMVSLLEYLEDDTDTVRTYENISAREETIEILGSMYDGRSVTRDIDVVKKIFEEFYYDGNVSMALLN